MQYPHPPTASVVDHLKRWPALAGALAWVRGQGALIRQGGRAGMARLLAWLSPVLLVLVGQVMAGGGVVNDAYSYIDDFNDNNGIDAAASSGYSNIGGSLQANAGTMSVQSPCFSLPQPSGGVFNNWLFLEIGTSQLGNTTGNTLTVQSCGAGTQAAGTLLASRANVAAGTVGLALNGIAGTETSIRLNWTVNHSVSPALGGTPARLDFWRVFGKSTGPTVVNVVPLTTAIQPSQSSVFRITFSSNGAVTRNAVLRLPMFDINGLSATGTAQAPAGGLASDAQKDYGNGAGLRVNRPVSVTAYSTAPDGSSATSTLVANATAGQLSWNLGDLPSGYSGSVTVTITVPSGTLSPSTVAARAYVDHGATPVGAITGVTPGMTVSGTSSNVTVTSPGTNWGIFSTGAYSQVGPGQAGVYYSAFPYNLANSTATAADAENVTYTVDLNAGTCTPTYKGFTWVATAYSPPTGTWRVLSQPTLGTPATTPLVIQIDRLAYNAWVNSVQAYVRPTVDVPATCATGTNVKWTYSAVIGNPSRTATGSTNLPVVLNYCRGAANYYMMRTTDGPVPKYTPWPGWTAYYIQGNGSAHAGEWIAQWLYGASGLSTQTVTLDHSYYVATVPAWGTFHGLSSGGNTSRMYKDSTGTAPLPTDAGFDHAANPPHAAWKPVSTTVIGSTPFSAAPNDNNPSAVVLPGTRLLVVRDVDAPIGIAPNYGGFVPEFMFRVADGSYGVTEAADGTALMSTALAGRAYTYETVSNSAGASHDCGAISNSTGYKLTKELVSWPVLKTAATTSVAAGGSTVVNVYAGNTAMASAPVSGFWGVNFFATRNDVDLANISASVVTSGAIVPPGGNAAGISFTPINAAACRAAVSSTDPACFAYFTVPANTQPAPAYLALRNLADTNENVSKQYPPFKLTVPILRNVPAGKVLSFNAELRKSDLTTLGADNPVATTRWAASNYVAAATTTVLESPSVTATLSAPANWPLGGSYSYQWTTTNGGNTLNNGFYSVLRMPRQGVSGAQLTPTYGKTYLSLTAADVLLESSVDANCFNSTLTAAWTSVPLQATARAGFASESAAAINASALCLRVRRNSSGATFAAGAVLSAAVDVSIPNLPANDGLFIGARALAGSSTTLGSTLDASPVETADAMTQVSSVVVTGGAKTFAVDPTRAGWMRWTLRYANKSGVAASNVAVTDILPAELIYQGLAAPLPAGVSCAPADCSVVAPNGDGTGGQLRLTVASLSPNDGAAGSGSDEGSVDIWAKFKPGVADGTVSSNCLTTSPGSTGIGSNGCTPITSAKLTASLVQTVVPAQGGSPPWVFPNDVLRYTLTLTNTDTVARYMRVADVLPSDTTLLAGSFRVNGVAAPETVFTAGVLSYTSAASVAPGTSMTLQFDAQVKGTVANNVDIFENMVVTPCTDAVDLGTCMAGKTTNTVQARVKAIAAITGTVYEDANYGGGAGRSLAASGGVARPNVRVELYDGTGAFFLATTTNASGVYSFTDLGPATYTVRVVNSTVLSARTGAVAALWPVQTWHVDASSGTVVADPNAVGGQNPQAQDAAANTSSATLASLTAGNLTPQSIALVKASTGTISGVDFGFNFSTIVNTNDSGQGSLRQWMTNANTLGGKAALAQSGYRRAINGATAPLPGGVETTVFMVPGGAAVPGLRAALPSQLSSGVALIQPASALPAITQALVSIDGTTQTANVSDSNAGALGAGGTVGASAAALAQVKRPEVQLVGNSALVHGLWLSGSDSSVRGLAVRGFGNTSATTSADVRLGGANALAEGNVIGTDAGGFADPGAAARSGGSGLVLEGNNAVAQGNLVGWVGNAGVIVNAGTGTLLADNEIRETGQASGVCCAQGIAMLAGSGATVLRNLVVNAGTAGIELASTAHVVAYNTVTGSGMAGAASTGGAVAGVWARGTGSMVQLNLVAGNRGAGVLVTGSVKATISMNATSNNGSAANRAGTPAVGALGIDLAGDGVSANDGAKPSASPNAGMDFPVVQAAAINGNQLYIRGYVGSASGQTLFAGAVLQLFKSDADASGYGEGATYLGTVTVDSSGRFDTSFTLATGTTVVAGDNITATATDASGNTSEFGPNVVAAALLTGTVFEDVHYGGGAGRSLGASGGVGLAGAVVEAYDEAGAFVMSGTTDASGTYRLWAPPNARYLVRVVNASVKSSRLGGSLSLPGVLTFRTEASTGSAVAVTDQVGGLFPASNDGPAGATGSSLWTTCAQEHGVCSVTGSALVRYGGHANGVVGWAYRVATGSINCDNTVFGDPALSVQKACQVMAATSLTNVSMGTAGMGNLDFGFNFDTVVNTNDAGAGSLRQAILNANSLGNDNLLAQIGRTAGIENLIFMLADGTARAGLSATLPSQFSGGVASIALQSGLPMVSSTLLLDAQTQPGWALAPIVELNCAAVSAAEICLEVRGDNSAVRGLVINRFSRHGLSINSGQHITVQGNYIGTNAAGNASAQAATSGTIGLVLSGNYQQAGGTNAAQRNVIAGVAGPGAIISSGTVGTVFEGNFVGVGVDGSTAIPNIGIGVNVMSNGVRIGGTAPGAGNLVSGQVAGTGLWITGTDVVIQGNLIGTNVSGTAAVPNGNAGVFINASALRAVVGGSTAAAGNVISGNTSVGLRVAAPDVQVLNNIIGYNKAGTAALPNAKGIQIYDTATPPTSNRAVIGLPGQGNLIAGNAGAGVAVSSSSGTGNAIRFNRIHHNGGLGIDLAEDGVSVNDGALTGTVNQMIDQPVFTGTVITGTGATTKLFVSGYVGSAPGQTTFGNVNVDVYTSDGDASGYGEGLLWLGTVATDASGNFRATIDLSTNPITPGTRLTAAATDAAGNTSEFGAIATANAGVGGTVFEDVNYGGGAARTWATAQAGGGRPVAGATVEVYAQGTGAFVSRTTTDASGSYLLPTPAAGFYNVRVVSGSVVSSRTASGTGLVPVPTLRSSSTGGTTVAITDQVGGPTPGAADVPANVSGANWSTLQVSASAKPTAWASVEAPSSQLSVGSVDFGFNFNTVVNKNDSGQGSLRQAITNANTLNGDSALAQVGRTAGIEHLIFMLADGTARAGLSSALPSQFSGGVASVALQSALPSVTAPLVLDAQTQPGWALAPLIELNGASAGTGATGLNLASGSSGSILRGFVVNRMSGDGVATSANNLTIQGNYLGTNASGSAAAANAVGLRLGAGGPLQVGGTTASQRNLISGNTGNGVHLDLYASSVVIEGNYIGLDANGSSAVANAGNGIYSSANYQGLRIGSAAAGGGNVISGNTGWGINLNQTDNPQVLGNRVGTNAAGTAAVRNGGGLYLIGVINGRIGGSAAGEGNLISGNASHGISDAGYGSGTRVIAGNVIGLGAVAGSVIGNLRSGIVSAQAGTLIGGSTAAAGNVISGNVDNGVWLVNTSGAAISLLNNTIGMDAAGLLARPNAVGVKIHSQWGAVNGNVIGAPGQGNLIAGNTGAGVQLPSGAGDNNSIRGNRMRGNGGLGIDLADNGVSANDGAKGSGSNKLMDYPVFTTANVRGDQLTVKGYVGSAAGQTLFAGALVDVYVSDNDSSGYGEGDLPLGTVVADANGNFSATLTLATGAVNTSSRITGTATDGSGSTSEFGPNFKLVVEWVINDNGDAVDANPGDGKCETAVAGKCTLRAAIMESNATPGMAAVFGLPNCPGAGCKISPTSALPAITSQLRIDGSTQPGFAGTPLVWLDGSGAGNVDGLVFSGAGAAGSSLRGLSVTGYAGSNGRAISLSAVSNVSLQGNFIGLLPDGVTTGANRVGVEVIGGSALLIGGVVAADGNRFAANTYGVALTGTGQRVVGNTFGLGGDGVSLVTPNLWAVPVWGGTDHQIGGTGPGEANAIVRGQRGVWLAGGLRNRVSGNSIRGQSGLGIDILGDGVTVNDGAVSAAKPNNGMDYPVLTLAAYNPATGRLTVQGYVGTAPGQTVFGGAQVELFKSDGNPSGYGSGAVYLGTVSTDANGRFDTAIVISSSLLALGDGLTATATDAVGNTSEFSGSFTVTDEALLKPARFNAFETDTPAGSITGVIRTKVAGAAATLSVIATNSAGTALHAGFTGNVALEWLDARNDSAAADAGACRASWLSLGSAGAVAFNNNARNDVSLTPPAGSTRSMRLRMTYAANGVTTVACSTDAFAVVPASLVIDGAFDTDAVSSGITRRLDNASASGGVVHNAGQPFTVQARALTASGAVMTGYDGTPDLVLATCELPSGCSGGTLTAPATAAAAGVYSNSSVRYAEVGVITLRLQDLSYAAVDVADTPAASRELRSVRVAAGRFVPDNYLLSVSTTGQLHTANASCTLAGAGYSFIGQGFGWATPTTVQVTARNATGGTTTLWTGSLMKLLPAHATGAMTASATGTATLSASYGALAVADLGSGQARITASNADQYTLQAAAAQASVSPLFSWALQLTDTSEASVAGNPTPTGHVTDAPIGFDLGGVFHSGRLALAGGHGDARQGVRMLVQLQRFTTTGWQTLNEDRGCVTVSPLNLGYSEPVGVFGAAGLCAAPVTSPSTTAGGRAWLGLPATPGGQTGQLTVRLLTGAGAANSCAAANSPAAGQSLGLAHLLGGQAAPGPTAHATWGLTNRDLLYRRERY